MTNIVDPFFLYQMGWIKPKPISSYCLFNLVGGIRRNEDLNLLHRYACFEGCKSSNPPERRHKQMESRPIESQGKDDKKRSSRWKKKNVTVYLGCNDPVHRCLGKRVKLFVLSAHELRLEQVAASTVVLKLSLNMEFYGKMLFFNCFCIRMMRF